MDDGMNYIEKAVALLFGSFLVGVGLNGFIIPYHFIDGGIIGISLLAKYTWGFKTGLTIIILSIPIYCLAWFHFRSYFFNSIHGLLLASFMIDVLAPLRTVFDFPAMISSIIGGLFMGVGIGIMLRYKTSTGGTDLLAQFISLKTSINVGIIIFLIDGLVVMIGSQVISDKALLYSALTIVSVGCATFLFTAFDVKRAD
jgi:uncharacterized membrane-anchored protein YitT (DUF2179 family)